MPIGSAGSVLAASKGTTPLRRTWRRAYGTAYGCSDLHTHIRWRAIRKVIETRGSVVDVGCGDGMLTLEWAKASPSVSVRGIDLDVEAIRQAEQTRLGLGAHNVRFEVADVSTSDLGSTDSVLMLDILEHVDADWELLRSASRAMRPGGRLVVSTPTPNFPRFFGREFHDAVGHVRDGYWPEELASALNAAGFDVEAISLYTMLPSSLVCSLYYRWLWRGKFGVLFSPVLNALSYLDTVWPFKRGASSVLVVARRSAAAATAA